MGATFSRLKNWIAETLTYADLNAEIDNILTNLLPAGVDDYSVNVTQMQTQTDPGEVGTESLATSLAGELERIRFQIKAMSGENYWYTAPDSTLAELTTAVGGNLNANRIASGKQSGNSDQAMFLKPNGAAATITMEGATTNLVYYIEGTQYTISTDVTVTGLTTAPSSNNTAAVDDPSAADGQETKYLGQYHTTIHLDTVGSEISGMVGSLAAFKINNGVDDEYFMARIKDSTTLDNIHRGYFWNSSSAHVPAIAFADNDTITLLKLTWVFATTAGGLLVSYNEPRYADSEPSSPATGDYWYDLINEKWKRYDSVSWVDADATLIGICAQDSTNCVAARAFDFFKSYQIDNTVELVYQSATEVRSYKNQSLVSVNGETHKFDHDFIRWNITTELESGESESSSTTYYCYITEDGAPKLSTKAPLELQGTRAGFYHQENTWRCVGKFFNDASSDIDQNTIVSTMLSGEVSIFSNNADAIGDTYTRFDDVARPGELQLTGTQTISRYLYAELYALMGDNVGYGDNADTFNLPDPRGRFIRITDDASTNDPDRATRTAMATGGNTGDNVGSVQDQEVNAHSHGLEIANSDANTDLYAAASFARRTDIQASGPYNMGRTTAGVSRPGFVVDSTGTETRPINFYMNMFMKVSR